ncbi:MAG: pilus assembly protein TadG-related protein [Gammaproteobacteria bacterium]
MLRQPGLHGPDGQAPGTRCQASSRTRQGGVVAVIFAVTLSVIFAMVGLAIDLSRVYNRKAELQGVAKAAALAAARQLDGTAAGVKAAVNAAASVVGSAKYEYNSTSVAWSESALQFSASAPPSAAWMDAGSAQAAPARYFYVKVDLGELDQDLGTVHTLFIKALSPQLATVKMSDMAIAGRSAIDVTPLAICALSPARAAARTNPGPVPKVELVEFGFRRGVSYDLVQINPGGSAGQTFIVDPISPPGTVGKVSNTTPGVAGSFVCAGKMWMPYVGGGAISVASPFPLAALYPHLNSRFGQYGGGTCKANGSPPDFNIKSYTYNGGTPWMSITPAGQTAASLNSAGKLWTAADPDPAPAGNTPAMYGPLWSYARAVPFSEYKAGEAEPAKGYTPFSTSDWPVLYKAGTAALASYPISALANTPYLASSGSNFLAPSGPEKAVAKRGRRVLNIPLLACPVASGALASATVLGIGKFFMTVPATSTSIVGEFAGAMDNAPGGSVELL